MNTPGLRPVLTIVIPAYNVAAFIRDAVTSALDQSYRDLEVIVVDDGSTDETSTLLEEIRSQRNDERLRVIRQENRGLSDARNTGITHARGDLIGFLDGDDIWLPEKAARHVAAMRDDPTIGISFSHSEYLSEGGRRSGSILVAGCAKPSLEKMIRRNHIGNGSTPVVRHACFDAAGLFRADLHSCEDYEMWCRILRLTSYRAELIDMPLTLYRLRSTSLSYNFWKFVDNAERAVDCLQDAMPDIPQQVFAAGRAEHSRIAAWKAVSSGQTRIGLRLLFRAVTIRPALLCDTRALGTLAAVAVPASLRMQFAESIKRITRRSGVASSLGLQLPSTER
jgi:GT2 family glycosyltransferase